MATLSLKLALGSKQSYCGRGRLMLQLRILRLLIKKRAQNEQQLYNSRGKSELLFPTER